MNLTVDARGEAIIFVTYEIAEPILMFYDLGYMSKTNVSGRAFANLEDGKRRATTL